MAEIPVHFELPSNLNIEKFISRTAKKFPLQLTSQYYAVKTFYDSFDWRLYDADLICELNQSKQFSYLNLSNYSNEQLISRVDLENMPVFASDFASPVLVQQLLPLLEMRAMLQLSCLNLQCYHLNILNNDEKTIARLTIEEYESLKHRVSLELIKGYEKAATQLSEFFLESLELKVVKKPVLVAALKAQGRFPGDYSAKLDINFDPNTPAHKAIKTIYKQLLQVIKLNEQDAINATDTEFLHDFRVAVRKTRAGLSQFKSLASEEVSNRYSAYFAWLGQTTSLTRDLDVYLLNFEHYKASLPVAMRDDLNPLGEFLQLKHKTAQQELAAQLKSKQYLTPLIDWEHYLEKADKSIDNKLSIQEFANARIWKIYQRVIKQGSTINNQSPPVVLHDLRKSCKKLRYLIEFFQNLYPETDIKSVLKALKELQELLGDFQDSAVQEQALLQFKTEMMAGDYPEQTFIAMEALAQMLEAKSCQARSHFSKQYAVFVATRNRSLFKSLFVSKT